MDKADLHIHTRASGDSVLTAEEIFRAARATGMAAISITDHDSTAGVAAGLELADEYGVFLLPGIEINGSWRNQLAHVLGYFPNGAPTALGEFIAEQIDTAKRRNALAVIELMAQHGVPITPAEYDAETQAGGASGSPLLRTLQKKGVVRDVDDYADRFYGDEYKPDECFFPAVTDVIASVKHLGGAAVLAHPGSHGSCGICHMDRDDIAGFVDVGLAGLEVHHPIHSDADTAAYAGVADELGLFKTGGSDSHGHASPEQREVGAVFCDWDEVRDRVLA